MFNVGSLAVQLALDCVTGVAGQTSSLEAIYEVEGMEISDAPRYEHRAVMVDVARNFHSVTEILKLIDAMAMYKLDKLHLHLADDEGWRLQITGLEELTEVINLLLAGRENWLEKPRFCVFF